MSEITDNKSLDFHLKDHIFDHRFTENNYGFNKLKSGEERMTFQLNINKLHQAFERNSRSQKLRASSQMK